MQSVRSHISVISFKVLNENVELIPLLAKWREYKHVFQNSLISNYSHSRASKCVDNDGKRKLPYSRNTIKKHIAAFIEHGLARMESGNLYFTSKWELNHADRRKDKFIWVHLDKGKDFKTQLFGAIAQSKFKQIIHARTGGNVTGNRSNKTDRKLPKHMRKTRWDIYAATPIEISNASLAELWKVSKSTASRTAKKVCNAKLMIKKLQKKIFRGFCSRKRWQGLLKGGGVDGNTFWYMGKIYSQPCAIYKMIHYNFKPSTYYRTLPPPNPPDM